MDDKTAADVFLLFHMHFGNIPVSRKTFNDKFQALYNKAKEQLPVDVLNTLKSEFLLTLKDKK